MGVQRLMQFVKISGTLRRLFLQYNSLGAEGCRSVGEMLLTNDSLR